MSFKTRRRIGATVAMLGAALTVVATAAIAGGALKSSSAAITLGPDEEGSVAAKCKGKGARAVAGGFDAPGFEPVNDGPYTRNLDSRRIGKREWSSFAFNGADDPSEAGDLVTYVYCSDELPKLKEKSATTEIEPNEAGSATVSCRRRGEAVSGGYVSGGSDFNAGQGVFPFESQRVDRRTWRVSGLNGGGEPFGLTVYAYCAKKKLGLKARTAETSTSTEAINLSATAECKKKEIAVSGGYDSPSIEGFGETSEVFESRRTGKRAWVSTTAAYDSDGGTPLPWASFAYCLKKKALG